MSERTLVLIKPDGVRRGLDVQYNIVHGSDSPGPPEHEIKIFFPEFV